MLQARRDPKGCSTPDAAIVQSATEVACRPTCHKDVGDEEDFAAGADELDPSLDARHEEWLRQQYLRDLDALGRIERQRGAQSDCDFFAAMGEIAHSQRRGR